MSGDPNEPTTPAPRRTITGTAAPAAAVPAGAAAPTPAPVAPATPAPAPAPAKPATPSLPRPPVKAGTPATPGLPAKPRPAAAPAGVKPKGTSAPLATQPRRPTTPARPRGASPPARRPPQGGMSLGGFVPPRGTMGHRTGLVLLVAGIILLGSGVGLYFTFYPVIANTQTAAGFLSTSNAQLFTNDPGVKAVHLTSSSEKVGASVYILDTVSSVQYNASAGVTLLTFQSISNEPTNERATQSSLAQLLFGTFSGSISWLKSGEQILMTFTIVQAQLPGGVYTSQPYLTLDAAADATHASLSPGGPTGLASPAIGQQYIQPGFNVDYQGLFIFLAIVGGLIVLGELFFAGGLERWIRSQTKDPQNLVVGLMGAMTAFAGFFMPFYPWPYVLLFVAGIMAVAWKFPQLSLVMLCLIVVPEVAYQSGALGLIFLVALIPILYAGLVDWRFGFGALLTLFLAPVGLSFAVPIFMALIFSLYLGLAVAVAGGLLITIFVTLGNLPMFGYLVGPGASSNPSLVAGHSAALLPALPWTFFSLGSVGAAYSNLFSPNFTVLAAGWGGLGSIAIPLAEIGSWCFAAWLIATQLHDREKQSQENLLRTSFAGGAVVAAVALVGFASFNYIQWPMLVVLLFLPAMVAVAAGALVVRDTFEAYFTSRMGATSVGTRVAEMKGLQKVTFEMVGGLHDVKADIKESMIIPLMRKDITTRFRLEPPKGLLLFGPPGCGKTMLMKALASELGVEMISIKCSDVMSKWYGESENKIADLLRTARERAPCILFMDEIDSIAKRRDMYTADDVTPRLLSILLSEMDGIEKSAGVIVVGSTNKPDLIDPALMRPGRLDKIIYVPPPDFNERMEVVHVHMQGRPVSGEIDLAEIAKKTERFSGADLANLVREAATIAVRREMMKQDASGSMTMEDFQQVIGRIKPSISLRMLTDYETMKMDYERKMHQVQRMERKVVVHWDDVGGLTDIKSAIREYVELPLTRPELMESYKIKTGRGILLFGPPGCGKTHIMRAAANELNVPMQIVNGPELVSALAGQSEAAVRDVLYRARENAPSIVFFDEIDALASKDSMRTPEVSRAVSQFLTEMDGLRPKDKVIIIATTNRPQTLDPALLRPGRFDKIFYVPPPDLAARQDIFRIHLKGVPVDGAVDFGVLAQNSEGYSGADIAGAVDEAKLIALRSQLVLETGAPTPVGGPAGGLFAAGTARASQPQHVFGMGDPTGLNQAAAPEADVAGVRMQDLTAAIAKQKPSITPETLAWAQEFIKSYGTRG
ncbi:MAG: AAA family ATPase [Thermoplasmata archaeon]|nr:AAA family ATPase [Thermoplasmata archaeon]